MGLERLRCLHFNDSKIELGGNRDRHANIGEGTIGAKGLAPLVGHPRIRDLPLLLEVPGEGDGPRAKDVGDAQARRGSRHCPLRRRSSLGLHAHREDPGAGVNKAQESDEEGCPGKEERREDDAQKGDEEGGPAKKSTAKKSTKKSVPAKTARKKPVKKATPVKKSDAKKTLKKVTKKVAPAKKSAAKTTPEKGDEEGGPAKKSAAKKSTKKAVPAEKSSEESGPEVDQEEDEEEVDSE